MRVEGEGEQDTLPVFVGMRKKFPNVSTKNYWHPVAGPVQGYLLTEEWNMRATDTRQSGWLKCSFNGCQYLFNRPCITTLIQFEQKNVCTALKSTAHVCPLSLLTRREDTVRSHAVFAVVKEKKRISRAFNQLDDAFLLFWLPSPASSLRLHLQVNQPHLRQSQLQRQKRRKDGFKSNK